MGLFYKILKARNWVNMIIYFPVRKILFLIDAERVHNIFIRLGDLLGGNIVTKTAVSLLYNYQNAALEQEILGIRFRNPVGLCAGFDKNAEMMGIMEDVGFGFTEVGSVTAKQCYGNPGIRMKRLIDKKALWVNLGLNNKGADELAGHFGRKLRIPVGVNVAKTNCKENADSNNAISDYVYSLKKFNSLNIGDYFVLNISCPNAFGGRAFHHPELYERLLKEVSKIGIRKPIFVKLSPDINFNDINKIVDISARYKISGFICSNLTKEEGTHGGYSGKLVQKKADKQLSYIYRKSKARFVIIGTGGIFSTEDAYKKIKLGANLVQLVTGMIYNGPGLIGEINLGLAELMKKDGFENIGEAVGKSNKRN